MSLAKDLKTYKPFALNVFQRNLSYKANVIMFFIGDGMILVVTYYLWKAIYASSSSSVINGFNFNEMVVYVMMSFLTGLIINTDVSYSINKPFALNVFQRNLSYKANVIMFFIGDGMILVVTYYLWKAIYASSSSSVINGFNFNEMVVYVMMSFLTGLIINTDVSYSIMSEVKDGSIVINLIRPISYQK